MALLTTATRMQYLRTLGFLRSQDTMVRNFQKAWNLGAWLTVDGLYGPKTDLALRASMAAHRAGRPNISAHFSTGELRCQCGGRYQDCQGVWMTRVHIRRLESLRTRTGPLRLSSGCRCPGHNKAVGGASSSQHMFGVGSDIPGILTLAQVRALKLFAGIGYSGSTGRVLHVDSRDIGGHNSTSGKPTAPTVWRYA
jgi:hypothetical protein